MLHGTFLLHLWIYSKRRILVCLRSSKAIWKVGLIKPPGLGITHVLYTLKRRQRCKQNG